MLHEGPVRTPAALADIQSATTAMGFDMFSDSRTGSLLRTLAASKPNGALLELGTGTGIATVWLLEGMDSRSTLLTVDNDDQVVAVAQKHLGDDPRVIFTVLDGGEYLQQLSARGLTFDLVFADTWPGKYTHLEETLELLRVGGIYIVDDMLPQSNWPDDHPPKVRRLIERLTTRSDLHVTRLNWSTGIIIAAKVT